VWVFAVPHSFVIFSSSAIFTKKSRPVPKNSIISILFSKNSKLENLKVYVSKWRKFGIEYINLNLLIAINLQVERQSSGDLRMGGYFWITLVDH
jgi:hypothetical protein